MNTSNIRTRSDFLPKCGNSVHCDKNQISVNAKMVQGTAKYNELQNGRSKPYQWKLLSPKENHPSSKEGDSYLLVPREPSRTNSIISSTQKLFDPIPSSGSSFKKLWLHSTVWDFRRLNEKWKIAKPRNWNAFSPRIPDILDVVATGTVLMICTGVFDVAVGASLDHENQNGELKLIVFFSRKLNEAKKTRLTECWYLRYFK